MSLLLPLLLFMSFVHAIPISLLNGQPTQESALNATDQLALGNIVETQAALIESQRARPAYRGWRLSRLDVEVGVSAKGDIGILGTTGNAAVELIWERRAPALREENVTVNADFRHAGDIFQQLRDQILPVFGNDAMKPRIRRELEKVLRRDAEKISRFAEDLVTLPRIRDWYVAGFNKMYYFGVDGKILPGLEAGYDRRIRVRFAVSGLPHRKKDLEVLGHSQKTHVAIMEMLHDLGRFSSSADRFELRRAWVRFDLNKELDLILFKVSKGGGFLIDYRRVPAEMRDVELRLTPKLDPALEVPQKFAGSFGSFLAPKAEGDFPLNQIRYKFSGNLSGGFKILTLEKTASIELHYLRTSK